MKTTTIFIGLMLTGLMSSAQNSTSPGAEVVTYTGQPV